MLFDPNYSYFNHIWCYLIQMIQVATIYSTSQPLCSYTQLILRNTKHCKQAYSAVLFLSNIVYNQYTQVKHPIFNHIWCCPLLIHLSSIHIIQHARYSTFTRFTSMHVSYAHYCTRITPTRPFLSTLCCCAAFTHYTHKAFPTHTVLLRYLYAFNSK